MTERTPQDFAIEHFAEAKLNQYRDEIARLSAALAEKTAQLEEERVRNAARQVPVAWVRRHPDGTLTTEFLADAAIEPVRKASGAWLPLAIIPGESAK